MSFISKILLLNYKGTAEKVAVKIGIMKEKLKEEMARNWKRNPYKGRKVKKSDAPRPPNREDPKSIPTRMKT